MGDFNCTFNVKWKMENGKWKTETETRVGECVVYVANKRKSSFHYSVCDLKPRGGRQKLQTEAA